MECNYVDTSSRGCPTKDWYAAPFKFLENLAVLEFFYLSLRLAG
jgi:hypothetical protein